MSEDKDNRFYLKIRISNSFNGYYFIEKTNDYGGVINPRLFLNKDGVLVKILGHVSGKCYYESKQKAIENIEQYFDVVGVNE